MRPALILIDFQHGFEAPIWGPRNNPGAEAHAAALLAHWRGRKAPLIHLRHLSQTPGSPLSLASGGADFIPALAPLPDETMLEKSVNSGFIGTDLEARLRSAGATDLVICGLTTPHCVSTTCRMAANLGFMVTLAHDACAAFASNANSDWQGAPLSALPEDIHAAAVSHLHGEFVTARRTDECIAEVP